VYSAEEMEGSWRERVWVDREKEDQTGGAGWSPREKGQRVEMRRNASILSLTFAHSSSSNHSVGFTASPGIRLRAVSSYVGKGLYTEE